MPTYVYRCTCGETLERVNRIAERRTNAPHHCGEPMDIVIQPPLSASVQAEAHYICPATGEKVTSRRQRKYLFEKHGLIDADDVNPGLKRAQDNLHAADKEAARQAVAGLTEGQKRAYAEAAQQITPG